jgi:fatty acid desaturase
VVAAVSGCWLLLLVVVVVVVVLLLLYHFPFCLYTLFHHFPADAGGFRNNRTAGDRVVSRGKSTLSVDALNLDKP